MAGVAVNVTDVPEHIAPAGNAAIVSVGAELVDTLIVIALEVAVAGDAQFAFEVITTVITSLLMSAALVYVEAVAPDIVTPFFFHT